MCGNEYEHTFDLIDQYTDLQRIVAADDPKKEAECQLKIVKVKLQAFNISTENFDIH